MLNEGDRVVIRKPANTDEFPYWMEGMDQFNGAEVTVNGLEVGQYGTTFDHKGYLFSVNWVDGADKNNTLTQPESPTLLDQFAMAALPAVIDVCRTDTRTMTGDEAYPEYVARKSYEIAQAMLKARPQ